MTIRSEIAEPRRVVAADRRLQPYIGKPRARVIVAYRQQHGPFKQVEDLKQIPVLKPEDWEKMRPYVRCE